MFKLPKSSISLVWALMLVSIPAYANTPVAEGDLKNPDQEATAEGLSIVSAQGAATTNSNTTTNSHTAQTPLGSDSTSANFEAQSSSTSDLEALSSAAEIAEQDEATQSQNESASQTEVSATLPPAPAHDVPQTPENEQPSEIDLLQQRALAGDGIAQLLLSDMYKEGKDVAKDIEMSLKWLNIAAEQDNTQAQVRLARMYFYGEIVPKNPDLAVKWAQIAANKGDSEAMFLLGIAHVRGEGLPKSAFRALGWLDKAYNKGHIGAKGMMGFVLYSTTESDEQRAEALKMMREACAAGRPETCIRLEPIEQELKKAQGENSVETKDTDSSKAESEPTSALDVENSSVAGMFLEEHIYDSPAPSEDMGMSYIVDAPVIL